MRGQPLSRLTVLGFLGVVAAGCCPPAAFYVETSIHPDGSCDRMILQPKDKFLPDEARKPEWKARWKDVSDASRPPVGSDLTASSTDCQYFRASGSFKNPGEIPPHYRFASAEVPDAGASELERTYETTDYGFVVEHRWREKITNIVTLAGFQKARDELLDLLLPLYTEAIEKIFGDDYDVSRLVTFLRVNVRQFLERASILVYDAAVRGRVIDEHRQVDPALSKELWAAAERCGLRRKAIEDMLTLGANEKDRPGATRALVAAIAAQYFRHRDGIAVTVAEADAVILAIEKEHRYEKAASDEMKRIEGILLKDEQFKKRIGRDVLQMIGLYGGLQFLFASGPPQYEFAISLPGELVESNGTGALAGRARWKLTSDELFPSGYEMKARSIAIDREAQKKVLGRVVIDDAAMAMAFMEIVGGEGPLLGAVRQLRETGDRKAFSQVQSRTYEERLRANKLRKMLFGE